MPSATVRTQSVNISRDPVRATWRSTQGSTRGPTSNATATNAATLASVRPRVTNNPWPPAACASATTWPPSASANAGSSTRTRTMARSSTINQPMAMRPLTVVMALRSSSAFSSTTVLATDRLSPSTTPAPTLQPHASVRPRPMLVAMHDLANGAQESPRAARPSDRPRRNAGQRRTSAA